MNFSPFFQNIQDFFAAPTFSLALQGTVGYVALIWIFIILWVAKDSGNRSDSILFQLISIILVVIATPLIGLPIYLLLRPSQTLFERDMCEMLQFLVEEESEEDEGDEEKEEKEKEPRREKKGKKQDKSVRKAKAKSSSKSMDADEREEEE